MLLTPYEKQTKKANKGFQNKPIIIKYTVASYIVFRFRKCDLKHPASEVCTFPALEDAVVPSDHRPPEPSRSELALIHRHGSGVGYDPHLLRNARREDRTVHDAEHEDEPEDGKPAEHGAPGPPHLDAAPAGPAVHGREDDNVDELERDGEACPRDGGLQPGLLLGAGDEDAADALGEGLLDGPDVTVAVEDGEAEGLEDGAAPGDGGGELRGGVDGVVEAENLEDEDGDQEEG